MPKFKHVLLAIAIALVFVFFVGFGIATFYKAPKYEDFCPQKEFKEVLAQEKCEEKTANGQATTGNFQSQQLLLVATSFYALRLMMLGKM